MEDFDRSNPVFYYDVDGIGGVKLKADGLELNDDASHDEAARELFEHMAEKVKLLHGKTYVILDAKEFYERFGDDEDDE